MQNTSLSEIIWKSCSILFARCGIYFSMWLAMVVYWCKCVCYFVPILMGCVITSECWVIASEPLSSLRAERSNLELRKSDCHVGTVLIPVLLAMTQCYQIATVAHNVSLRLLAMTQCYQIATSEQYWFPSSSQWRSVIRLPCRNSIDSSPPRNDAILSDCHVGTVLIPVLLAMTQCYQITTSPITNLLGSSQWRLWLDRHIGIV
jgi:hypothetical protein